MASSKKKVGYFVFIVIIALLVVSIFYRLPYYIMQPGDTHDLGPVIDVKDGHKYKDGDFLFMTVQVIQPNVYQYVMASFEKYHTIMPLDQMRQKGENQEEYNTRQMYYMDESQEAAAYTAYRKAGKHPKLVHDGMVIANIIKGMPAEKKLKAGDVIVKAQGHDIKTGDDLLKATKGKTKGDTIKLTVLRDGKKKQETVAVGHFPKDEIADQKKNGVKHPKKYGMGVKQVPRVKLKAHPKISFHTEKIGGPSGGLMFTLDIYNRLTEANWTKGYKIAGTGTMSTKGEVGPIGGIKEKVVAADKDGVDIFFAPKKEHNYTDAAEAAKDIDTDMKVVEVATFDDALDYLKKLKPKNNKANNEAA